jgi:hypothetical protein
MTLKVATNNERHPRHILVIPAAAGIKKAGWITAFAGVTLSDGFSTVKVSFCGGTLER